MTGHTLTRVLGCARTLRGAATQSGQPPPTDLKRVNNLLL